MRINSRTKLTIRFQFKLSSIEQSRTRTSDKPNMEFRRFPIILMRSWIRGIDSIKRNRLSP